MIHFFILLCSLLFAPIDSHAGQPSARALDPNFGSVSGETPPFPEDWVTVKAPLLDVHSEDADRPTALRLSRHAATAVPRLAKELALPVGPRIHVVLAHTQKQFQELQPGRTPTWADGTAWPHRGWIYLRRPELRGATTETLETVLDHEIVHVLLGRAFGPQEVPRWLQEGMAQLLAGEYTAETTNTLAKGTLGNSLLSLHELARGFPKDPVRAQLAYAQSADFVAWIRNQHGKKATHILIQELAAGENFPVAIRMATGQEVDDIDKAWRTRLQDSPFQLSPLFSEGVWWGLGALLVPLAWFAVRRRNKVKLTRWKREEVLEDALYRAIDRNFKMQEEATDIKDDTAESPIWPIQ
ncbi:MAG: hypothetical protein CL930_01155 [Deltaproteobacteria bacterium]|nr:hypothetical protein [Deltaproteobacteria bacterium]